jgi:hypothetical protein
MTKSEWISVKDKLPENGQVVLINRKNKNQFQFQQRRRSSFLPVAGGRAASDTLACAILDNSAGLAWRGFECKGDRRIRF